MVATDPTLELLARFESASNWAAVKAGVPIFKPHTRVTADGREVAVKAADLYQIAAKAERLERAHGVPLRLTLGHVLPELPDADPRQPPLVGYARKVRVGTFGPTSEPCLLADLYFLPGQYDQARDCPYRSGEYYPPLGELRGVALLKRDPYLPLGMVTYSDDDMADDAKTNAPPSPDGGDAQAPAPAAGPDPEWVKNMDAYAAANPWVGYAMQCYQGASPMGPTNGAAPGAAPAAAAPAPAMPLPDDMVRMQLDQQRLAYQRVEDSNRALQARIAALEAERETARCEALVTQLQAERYELDRATEVAALVPLTPEQRQARLAYVRKHHRQSMADIADPVPYGLGGFVPLTDRPAEVGGGPLSAPDNHDAAMAYMRDRPGTRYEAALAATTKN